MNTPITVLEREYENAKHTLDSLWDRILELKAENDELQRENARLQDTATESMEAMESVGHLLWDGKNDEARQAVHDALRTSLDKRSHF